MPWNGVGDFILDPSFSPEVNGTEIDADRYNGLTLDIADGISASLNKNGENTPSTNINWGAFKITNLGPGTVAGDALAYGQPPPQFVSNTNAATDVGVRNVNGGVHATSGFTLHNGTANAEMLLAGTGFTDYAIAPANCLMVYNDGTGGLLLNANNAAGSIKFAAGGPNPYMELTSDGALIISGGDLTSAGILQIFDDGAAGCNVKMTGQGPNASKFIRVLGGTFQLLSSDYSRAILSVSDAGAISDQNGFELGTKNLQGASISSGSPIAADHGLCVYMSGAVTIPNSVFATAHVLYLRNNTGGALAVNQGSGLTMRLSGTTGTGNRVIAPWGFAWLHFLDTSTCFLQGDVA